MLSGQFCIRLEAIPKIAPARKKGEGEATVILGRQKNRRVAPQRRHIRCSPAHFLVYLLLLRAIAFTGSWCQPVDVVVKHLLLSLVCCFAEVTWGAKQDGFKDVRLTVVGKAREDGTAFLQTCKWST